LDGFDEIATAGWAGKTKKLRDLRYRSMEILRTLLRETPRGVGILIAGRAHFFDNFREMRSTLGLSEDFISLSVSEFNEEQVREYLAKMGWTAPIPAWVPSRPLLLGYLASRKLLQQTLEVEAGSGPAVGWDALLDRVCEREAEIEAGIDPGTVRRLLGYLATLARNSADGLGPLSPDQIPAAFAAVCGYPPDDRGMVLLQRLPGLGGHSSEDGARVFVDLDFAEAARGATTAEFVQDPFAPHLSSSGWQSSLLPLGAEVAACRCKAAGFAPAKVAAALTRATAEPKADTLAADIVLTLLYTRDSFRSPEAFIKEVIVPELSFDDLTNDLRSIQFQDCILGQIELPPELETERIPRFLRCHFGVVEGRTGPRDMPAEVFRDCTFDIFENPAQTTNAILALGLPTGTKVVLTILRKLYAQRGSGRRESALHRGLDARANELVPQALGLLRRHGFATRSRQADQVVWLRSKPSEYRRRALSILAAPTTSADPLLTESRDIGA
jgi:hypothetical protein